MRARFLTLAAVAALVAASPTVNAGDAGSAEASTSIHGMKAGSHGELARTLARVRQATKRFRDINVALSEGYVIPPPGNCITAEAEGQPRQLGAMGVHVVRPDLLGITAVSPRVDGVGTHTDFTRPAVLVYEPQADGSMELVAVENLVFAQAWHAAGHVGPPSFHGYQYYYMIDNPLTAVDEAHGFAPHYELHMWLYRENPAGMFMPFNARSSCAAGNRH